MKVKTITEITTEDWHGLCHGVAMVNEVGLVPVTIAMQQYTYYFNSNISLTIFPDGLPLGVTLTEEVDYIPDKDMARLSLELSEEIEDETRYVGLN